MTKRDLDNLLLKAFSIYSFLTALNNASYLASYLFNNPTTLRWRALPELLSKTIPSVSMALAGILLWVMSRHRSKLKEKSEDALRASHEDIQIIAFSLGGVYLVAYALPEFIQFFVIAFWLQPGHRIEGAAFGLAFPLIRLCIGFLLLFGAKGIVPFLRKIRQAGQTTYDASVKVPDGPGT